MMQEAIAGAAEQWARRRGPRPRLGPRLRRGDRRRPRAHERAQPAPRRGDRHVRGRPPRDRDAWPASDTDLDLAVLAVDTGDVDAAVAGTPAPATRRRSARPVSRSPTPAGAACAPRSASSRPAAAASAARAGAASAAPSSTPRRSRAAPRAVRSWIRKGPARRQRRAARRRPDPRRARRRRRAGARRWARPGRGASPHRLGVAIAPPRVARRLRSAVGLPERDGLLVRAVEDEQPGAARPASSPAT